MLYSSVYNLFALIGRKAPFTHSLDLGRENSDIKTLVGLRFMQSDWRLAD